ncbi:preprotein translocase subunit SecA [Myxococcota bacterium]
MVRHLISIFVGAHARRLARYHRLIAQIGRLEPKLQTLSDGQLQNRARALRLRAQQGTSLNQLVIEAFAIGREASRRTLGLRPFDVQLIGGLALHDGYVVEMKTGEGKTLAATLPAYFNALSGNGVHVVTVNDYLAERDAEWMAPLYRFLGLSVGVILEDMGGAAHETPHRRAAYACDITYGTNHEIAFDYLRDNLATSAEEVVQRGFHYAIVDEVDFLLIDEARTPLVISGPAREDLGLFDKVDQVVRNLFEDTHYVVEPKTRTASLTEAGFDAVQTGLRIDNLCDLDNIHIYHAAHQSVLAHGTYKCDVDYIVENGQVFIVDEFTGRVSEDKRFSDGLHQAIEAKERVSVQPQDRTLAQVTYQTFFGRYHKLAGMTGTAKSERQEFTKTYGREVQVIPTHRPMIRRDYQDQIFNTLSEKHAAVVREIMELRAEGRPVLVGTSSVRESEQLSMRLRRTGQPHSVLNAKSHRVEAAVVAQAGRKGAVTISTNMAGRGTDIILGGNPEMMFKDVGYQHLSIEELRSQCDRERDEVVAAGGLHVIGTSHHEAARIDDQLRGRAGRQGDPGSSQFIVSLDDDIWKKFGKFAIPSIRANLRRSQRKEGESIGSRRVARVLRGLQKKVDHENEATRRDVLKFDLVIHSQRETIYSWRRGLVTGEGFDPEALIRGVVVDLTDHNSRPDEVEDGLQRHFHVPFELHRENSKEELIEEAVRQAVSVLEAREGVVGREILHEVGRLILLQAIDELWTDHLTNLERVEDGIGLCAYAEVDPVIAWRKEATTMWHELLRLIRSRAVNLWFLVDIRSGV